MLVLFHSQQVLGRMKIAGIIWIVFNLSSKKKKLNVDEDCITKNVCDNQRINFTFHFRNIGVVTVAFCYM